MSKEIVFCILAFLALIGVAMVGIPQYIVYSSKMKGEANYVQAQQEKKIMIETALAEKESAKLRAEAIDIIGESAKKYPEYRQQEFMQAFGEALREGNISQIIYVPTEANLPILEAKGK